MNADLGLDKFGAGSLVCRRFCDDVEGDNIHYGVATKRRKVTTWPRGPFPIVSPLRRHVRPGFCANSVGLPEFKSNAFGMLADLTLACAQIGVVIEDGGWKVTPVDLAACGFGNALCSLKSLSALLPTSA
jgi:hypothetical protein